MDRSRGHIPELDGVRAIAVLMVLAAHWPIASQRLAYTFGGLGVSIFFTLSGFLITRILMFNRENGIGIRQFWITRAARIFPLSVAVLIVIGACFGFDDEWWQALTFTYNLLREPIRDNPVSGRPKPATCERRKTSHVQGVICPVGCPVFEPEPNDGESTERGERAIHFNAVFPRLFVSSDRPDAGAGPADGAQVCARGVQGPACRWGFRTSQSAHRVVAGFRVGKTSQCAHRVWGVRKGL